MIIMFILSVVVENFSAIENDREAKWCGDRNSYKLLWELLDSCWDEVSIVKNTSCLSKYKILLLLANNYV